MRLIFIISIECNSLQIFLFYNIELLKLDKVDNVYSFNKIYCKIRHYKYIYNYSKEKMMQTLADKFRPAQIDDIVGQEHILGKGKVLRRLIENKIANNLILFGPPGIGKTTIATLVAQASQKKLFKLNGTTASVKDIQEIAKTLDTLEGYNGVILYLDEIHAFSKSRQSSILSYLETGEITLIASTTENPYHSIHPAILSRCMVFELKPISNEDIIKRLKICVNKASDSWRVISYEDDALEYIANISNGDLRKAIGILEIIINSHLAEELHIDIDMVKEVSQKNISMNKSDYYDWVSMLQKKCAWKST